MAALWEQIRDVSDMLQKLITKEGDGVTARTFDERSFDSIAFGGNKIHVVMNGVRYVLTITRPIDQSDYGIGGDE